MDVVCPEMPTQEYVQEMMTLSGVAYEDFSPGDFPGLPDEFTIAKKRNMTPEEMAHVIKPMGYVPVLTTDGDVTFEDVKTDTEFIVCFDKRERENERPWLVVSFRGTETKQDMFTDIKGYHPCVSLCGGGDHVDKQTQEESMEGFQECFEAIKDMLHEAINRTIKEYNLSHVDLIFTGHSLGGALATISAYTLAKEKKASPRNHSHIHCIQLITFGAPRPCAMSWAPDMLELIPKNLRVVNQFDVVARVPNAFHHAGHLLYLAPRRHIIERLLTLGGDRQKVFFDPPRSVLWMYTIIAIVCTILPFVLVTFLYNIGLWLLQEFVNQDDHIWDSDGWTAFTVECFWWVCTTAFMLWAQFNFWLKRGLEAHMLTNYAKEIQSRSGDLWGHNLIKNKPYRDERWTFAALWDAF